MTVILDSKIAKDGLVLTVPALAADPGSAAELLNYETDLAGGFRRIDGYERFDGKTPPSSGWSEPWPWVLGGPDGGSSPDGVQWEGLPAATGNLNESVTLTIPLRGLSLVGGIRMAPGGEFALLTHELNNAHYTGQVYTSQQDFLDAIEAMPNVASAVVSGGNLVVTSTVPMIPGIYPRLELLSWTVLDDSNTEETLRNAISGPPGVGPIYGLATFKGIVICARNFDEEGNLSRIYRSTPNGWEQIPMPVDTISTGTVTGATDSTLTDSGEDWAEDELAGLAVLIKTGAGAGQSRTIVSNTATTITIEPDWDVVPDGTYDIVTQPGRVGGAKYTFVEYNFYGDPARRALYGADGKNKAFEISGNPYPGAMVYTEIDTVITRDVITYYPKKVAAHAMHLFLSFEGGWVQYSGIGNPFSDDVNEGAGGIAYPDEVTNMLPLKDSALAITTRDNMYILYGTSEQDWQSTSLSAQGDGVGAVPDTLVSAAGTFFCDPTGIFRMDAVQSFGNFATASMSLAINALYQFLSPTIVGAAMMKSRGIYRLYCQGGEWISMTSAPNKILGFGYGKIDVSPRVVAGGTMGTTPQNQKEVILIGGEDGMVYTMDRGDTFDGEDIPAAIRFHFHNGGNPRQVKRWRKAVFEIKTPSIFEMQSNAIFDYGGEEEAASHEIDLANLTQSGGIWDVSHWNEFFWLGKYVGEGEMRIDGHARSVSLMLFCEGRIPSFVIEGYTVHHSPRRLAR
jgi:hypothetical protein